jgi:iron(III) transport system permease protein
MQSEPRRAAQSMPPKRAGTLSGLWQQLARPEISLGIVLFVVLAYLVILPLFTLVRTTFTVTLMDSFRIPGAKVGELTLYHWRRIFRNLAIFLGPLRNSIIIAIGTAFIALLVGSSLAWLIKRTNIPGKGILNILAVTPYVLPSWALALPWLEFFRNSSVNCPAGFLQYYTGIQAPEWLVFGPVPIMFVMGIHYFPFVYLMVAGALENIDSQIEEASELLGASKLQTICTVTLPSVMPAMFAALLLSFSRTIGTYGTPALLGGPANFTVLSVQIRSFMQMNLASQAYILTILLIAISIILLYLNDKVIGVRKNYSLIGGKGFKARLNPLGKFRWLIFAICIMLLAIFVVAPLLLLVWSSFMSSSGSYGISNFTLHYWLGAPNPALAQGEAGVLRNPRVWQSTLNSLKIAFLGGLICAFLGMIIGYVVVRTRGSRFASVLERLSFIPMLIPSIAFGAIYLSLFSQRLGPFPALYGTFALMVLVVIGKQLPFSTRTGVSAMHQVAGELEEAAKICGASFLSIFREIIWPLTRTGFISGLMIVFVTIMRELSLFILLMSPRTEVLTTLTFRYAEISNQQLSNALMSYLVLVVFLVMGLTKRYEKYISSSKPR